MKEEKKKAPPSRLRYEQAHPTVSCRVPKEMYDELEIMKKSEGKSLADILKIGLGRLEMKAAEDLEMKAAEDSEIRNEALVEGFEGGYSDAEGVFKVTYPCSVCGGMMVVSGAEEKAAITRYMREHGWGHQSCQDKR